MNKNIAIAAIVFCILIGMAVPAIAQSGLHLVLQDEDIYTGWVDDYLFEEPVSTGNTFYIDPSSGKSQADGGTGSAANPWRTLQEVMEEGLIEYYGNSASKIYNEGAPVQGGDTLVLLSGYHGYLYAQIFNFNDWLTIKAANNATPVLSQVNLYGTFSHIYLKDITILREAYGNEATEAGSWYSNSNVNGPLLYLRENTSFGDAHDIKVNGLTLMTADNSSSLIGFANPVSGWTRTEWRDNAVSGISVSGVVNVEAVDCDIQNIEVGLALGGCEYSYYVGNTIKNFTIDGVRALSDFLYIAENHISDACRVFDYDENHYDGLQSWSVSDGGVGTGSRHDVMLIGNTIIADTGASYFSSTAMQGMGLFDGFFDNWLVENNVIVVSHYHGISFYGLRNGAVLNNTIIDLDDTDSASPWILVTAHKDGTKSENVIVANNIAANSVTVSGIEVAKQNNFVFGANAYSNMYNYFVDVDGNDFDLKKNSYTDADIINKGSYFSGYESSKYDVEGEKRDALPDIGAYEY